MDFWRAVGSWWLAHTLIGWLAWPLAAQLGRHTPGRGYVYARPVGLVTLGYVYWLLGIAGLVPNRAEALWAVTAALAVMGLSMWARQGGELVQTLRNAWRQLLAMEILFAATLLLYAAHRAYDPAIAHTEQPMDFAFLNALLRSPRLPPNDPWLAGFPISYYYFGHLTVAILARLTGLPAGIAYNLGLAHTLALGVVGGYGLIHALVLRQGERQTRATAWGIAGGLALMLAGNWEGLCEALRARGWGADAFYRWLAVPGLAEARPTGAWLPAGTWWWRASRVFQDANPLGRTPTVITEFPAFSFILGDLHPHVMALPYVLLALSLALELYHAGQEGEVRAWWRQARFWLLPLFLGSLGMINSWDLPTFLVANLLALCLGLWRRGLSWRAWPRSAGTLILWLVLGSVAYFLPFYRGLSSQAQGIGLAYYAKTPLRHYMLCFGPWLVPLFWAAIAHLGERRRRPQAALPARTLVRLWLGIVLSPWLITLLLGGWGRTLWSLVALARSGPWTLLVQSALLALACDAVILSLRAEAPHRPAQILAPAFALLGLALTYGCEFLYLDDFFATRMNTVFKLYYQAWVLLGSAALATLAQFMEAGGWQRLAAWGSAALLLATLYYPLAAAYTVAEGYGGAPTLDGTEYLRRVSPAEYGAWRWLEEHATGQDIIAESPGEDYHPAHNRLSAWSGVPTILGWPGHEVQWRGGDAEVRRRIEALATIYTDPSAERILATLRAYQATYLFIGPYERKHYGLDTARVAWYETFLQPVYAQEEIRLYRLPR
jgi:YYY domain-containing protein